MCRIPFVALVIATSLLSAQDQRVARFHDLGGLETLRQRVHRVFLTPPLQASAVGPAGESAGRESWGEDVVRDLFGGADFITVLADIIGPEAIDDVDFDVVAGRLLVRATPAIHDRIATAVRALYESVTASVALEAHVLPRAALRAATGTVLTARQADALLKEHKPLATMLGTARVGDGARLIAARRRSLVTEFDVEVAQESFAGDSIVKHLLLGWEIGVEVHEAASGRLFLLVGGRDMDLLGIREQPTGKAKVLPTFKEALDLRTGTLQLARSQSAVCRGSATVENGGGLLLGHGKFNGGLWLIRARRVAPVPAWSVPETDLLRVGDLMTPTPHRWTPGVGPPNPSGFGAGIGSFEEEDGKRQERFAHVRRIEDWFADERDGDEEPSLRVFGDYLLCRGSDSIRRRVRADVSDWARRFARTVEFEVRVGTLPGSTPAQSMDPASLASQLGITVVSAAREGDEVSVLAGEEQAILKDHDIEISQAATGPDPIVDSVFAGVHVKGRLSIGPDETVLCDGLVFWQEPVNPRKSFDLRSTGPGPVDQVDLAHVKARDRWKLRPHRWTLLMFSPVEGTDHAVACIATVRVRN